MIYLAFSIVALFFGPLLVRIGGARPRWLRALDGFVLVAVGGIVLLHLLPHSVEVAGWWAVVAAGAGFILPAALERSMDRLHQQATPFVLVLICAGLAVHGVLDGAALVDVPAPDAHGEPTSLLAMGVILHRLPIGLVIWWTVEPVWGPTRTLLLLALIAAGTAAGVALGGAGVAALPVEAMTVLQALVAGSLLHVVIDHPRHLGDDRRRWRHIPAAAGAAVGVATVVFLMVTQDDVHVGHAHGPSEGVFDAFLALSLESAPALIIAFVGAGLVHAFVQSAAVHWLRRGGSVQQATRGVVFGLPLPICSCGVVPLYRSLVQAGVPTSGAVAFLIATPELGLDAILISLPRHGAELTIARVAAAVVVALVAALIVARVARRLTDRDPAEGGLSAEQRPPTGPLTARVKAGLAYGLGDMVDHIAPWIVAGLFIAAVIQPFLAGGALGSLPAGLDVPVMALIGIPAYVCASAATPLVAVLVFYGLSPGAAIAFLLTGPATNVVTFGVLTRLHSARFALIFGATVGALAIGLGYLVNVWLPEGGPGLVPTPDAHGASAFEWTALGALVLLFGASIVRQGPRSFISEVLAIWGDRHDDDGHGHSHDHGHGHDHDHDRGTGAVAATDVVAAGEREPGHV